MIFLMFFAVIALTIQSCTDFSGTSHKTSAQNSEMLGIKIIEIQVKFLRNKYTSY